MSVLEPIDKDGPPESSDGAKLAHVKDRIREMILKGELAPGHPIRERTLANLLGVSRTPMREAVKLLAGENLVELHPHRGAIVAILRRNEVFEIIQVLAALEGLAAELACTAITDKEMAELWALHYEMLAFRARPLLTAHVASIWTRLSTILDEDGTITEQVPVT